MYPIFFNTLHLALFALAVSWPGEASYILHCPVYALVRLLQCVPMKGLLTTLHALDGLCLVHASHFLAGSSVLWCTSLSYRLTCANILPLQINFIS